MIVPFSFSLILFLLLPHTKPMALFSRNGVFQPRLKKMKVPERRIDLLRLHRNRLVDSGMNLSDVVQLPPNEDRNEWLAVNVQEFVQQTNMLLSSVAECCTEQSCPTMTAGEKYEYLWADGVEIRRPVKLSAPAYIDALMKWIDRQFDDQKIFPCEDDLPFPRNFEQVVKMILKRLFRVFAHIYHHHFEKIVCFGEEAQLNTLFKHFYFFIEEFDLVDHREFRPLQELINMLCDVVLVKPAKQENDEPKPNQSNPGEQEPL